MNKNIIIKLKIKNRLLLSILLFLGCGILLIPAYSLAATDEWTTSLHDISRDGASSDTSFSTSNVAQLEKEWSYATGAPIASQPAIVNGVAYVGSWNGDEYAFNLNTGAVLWSDNLGTTTGESDCNPQNAGVSSAPTVLNGVVYVGGGANYWYALNATTGAVLWKVYTGDSSAAGGHYNWSSPLILNGYAYIGIASLGDCPLIQGQLMKVQISTGDVISTLNLVPDGEVGAGIWTSPSYDPTTNRIFAVTGTEQSDAQNYAQAIIAIDPDTMTVVDYWHLPEVDVVADSDWTTSAMLFSDSNGRQLVMASDKNGYSYAFLRSNLAAGPVWQQQIAVGNDCAACGYSTVSSATFSNGVIYQAGGVTTVNGVGVAGSVQAWNPNNGAVIWQHAVTGPVIGAITYMNGMVIDGAGSALEVLNASNGQRLYSYDTAPGSWIFAAPAVGEGTIVTGNTFGTIFAWAMPATGPLTPPPDPNCPSGWTCQDIGSPSPAGSETVTSGSWNISAGGNGVAGSSDSFRLMSEPTAGNAQITAQVTSQQYISTNAQTGIMIRQNNGPGSPYYAVFATPNGVKIQFRNTPGGTTTVQSDSNPGNVPIYLEIQDIGDILTAATSTDGITYTLVPGSSATVIMPYASLAGLAVSSGNNGTTSSSTISKVVIGSPSNTPQDTLAANACPSSWVCQDIGDPLLVGNQSLSGGTWTVSGTGNGIDGSSDQFHFITQTIAGDATVTAHIDSQSGTGAAAKTGLMMRANNSPSSAYYGAFMTNGNGVEVEYRSITGLPAEVDINVSNTDTTPQYLQITRSGDTFTTYTSSDGNNWRPLIGSSLTFSSLSGSILAGYAVTSANANTTNNSTADSLSVTVSAPPSPTNCPASWICETVGDNMLPSGSQYYVDGVWSTLGGGKDIFGSVDDFYYDAQTMAGNGTVTTEITSQGNTDPFAKAGLMVRDNTNGNADPSAAYFAILTTPSNGTVVQYRSTESASTTQLTGVTTEAPVWLRITRAGNSFTAYTSTDGNTWTAFPGMPITVNLPTTALAGLANTSHSQFLNSTAVFNDYSLVTPNANLPSPWQDSDIGNPTPAGSASEAGGVFTVNGGGNDIWTTPYANLDQFHYVWQTLNGNGSIVARVTAQTNTSAWAKAGIMIKQSAAANAPYALLAVTPTNGITFQSNFNTSSGGGNYTFPNAWLELNINGTTVTAYASADGVHWTEIGTTTINVSGPVTAGLFVSAHNSGTLSTATFDNVNLSTGGLPMPWTDNDIGNPTPAGSAGFSGGVFTINGGGNDIWGTPGGNLDQFNYVSQTMSGDETITARVTSQTNTSAWAKAGIMIKQSTTAGSPYALLAVTPSNGITFQSNYVNSTSGGNYTFPNTWLRLMISGGTVTAYVSADGNTWTEVGTTPLALTYPATIGLFDCAHNAGTLSTVTIDNAAISANSTLPVPWTDKDVGNPTPAGSASYASGVYTLNGGGNDIWGTPGATLDQFNYLSQPLTNASETIIARVTSQTNTSAWAKAGVMIKQSTTAGSAYVLLGVTPGNGITFQYGFNSSVSGGSFTFPNAWLKLSISNGAVTAYSSPNGSTWTEVGTTTLTLTSPATIGLFDCAHNAGTLSTVTMDNVSLTSP